MSSFLLFALCLWACLVELSVCKSFIRRVLEACEEARIEASREKNKMHTPNCSADFIYFYGNRIFGEAYACTLFIGNKVFFSRI